MTVIQQIKKKERRKVIIGILLGVLGILIPILVIAFMTLSSGSKQDVSVEKNTVESTEAATTSYKDISYEQNDTEGLKEYYIDYVWVSENQNISGLLDIHIRFPDGEDYVVASGKRITRMMKEGFYMFLTDRDVYMLSSALTDRDVYEGTKIYLSTYNYGGHKEDKPDYPCNAYVMSSLGTDIMEDDDIFARRIQLEENLLAFMNKALEK